ncbi:MAG: FAD-dependent oxidoreductase [Candidatus Omnitrophica bacterium]|nr:FAD-dependent oxidoreductase [Candidatus Omnitrophota bacterium]
MQKIIVVGGGVSGLSFIRKIREKRSDVKITLVDKASHSFNKSDFLNTFSFRNRIDLGQFCSETKVEFIQDALERINVRRKKIYFKNKESRDFEKLVIATGLKSKKITAKGEHREGFFYLSSFDLLALRNRIKMFNEITVFVSTILGVKLALGLRGLGKDVSIVTGGFDFLGLHKEKLENYFRENDISVYQAAIEEAIGEGTVKAVKIKPLKILSSQIVLVDSGFTVNRDFFEEDIKIRDNFFTDCQDLYFVGDVNNSNIDGELFFGADSSSAESQGESLADYILDGKQPVIEISNYDKEKAINNIASNRVNAIFRE